LIHAILHFGSPSRGGIEVRDYHNAQTHRTDLTTGHGC
jgi:hypothetical protein